MGIFDKLRGALAGDDKPRSYKVTFTEPKLGMTLAAGHQDETLVKSVVQGSPAGKADVRPGDVVDSVNGRGPPKYSELIVVISALGRPLELGFSRGDGATSDSKSEASTSGNQGGMWRGGAERFGLGGVGAFQRVQQAAGRRAEGARSPPAPPMTEEEKAERREAALRAAESRAKEWDNKLGKGKRATQMKEALGEVTENRFEESSNAETRRMVELAKKQEAQTAEAMGYNPYEARLMGNSAARAAMLGVTGEGGVPISVSSPEPNGLAPRQPSAPAAGDRRATAAVATAEEEFVGEEAALAVGIGREIEQALGLLLEQGPALCVVAVQTMLKMMRNMSLNSSEDKFKRIRLANANFQAKVGGVEGGIEVMLAAGYVLQTEADETYLQHGSCDPVPLRLRVAMKKLAEAENMLKEPTS